MAEEGAKSRRPSWSSLAAGSIAILALSVSLWQGYEERRHNRLSVRPLLTYEYTYHPEGWFELEVTNSGFGPAGIEEFAVFVDDRRVSTEGGVWSTALRTIGGDYGLSHTYNFNPGDGFPPGARQKILRLDDWETGSGRIRLDIRYASIYGERWVESAAF